VKKNNKKNNNLIIFLGGYGVSTCSHLTSARKTSTKKELPLVALFYSVLQGFVFGELPLHHLPLARRKFGAKSQAVFPAFLFTLQKRRIDKK